MGSEVTGIPDPGKECDRPRDMFAMPGDLRRGALSRNATGCGKPTCNCAEDGGPGHPGHVLKRSLNGRAKTIRIRAGEVEETRKPVGEFRRFRNMVTEFLEASGALAEARPREGRAGTSRKRGLSRPPSRDGRRDRPADIRVHRRPRFLGSGAGCSGNRHAQALERPAARFNADLPGDRCLACG